MLGWSLNLFRIRGIQLAVHFSFLLLLAFVGFKAWTVDGWAGVLVNVFVLLVLFTCIILHELGHSFTAMAYGVGVRRILLLPIGGMAEFDSIPREPGRELLITLAGPAVNFAIAALLVAFVSMPDGWSLFNLASLAEYPDTWTGFAQLLVHWNLLMGCFNLIPVFPMDGGRIFRALLALSLPYLRATFVAATLGKILALVGILVALLAYQEPHYLNAILFAFIFFAGELEYRAARRRELDEAHWRTVLARIYASPHSTDEPPLLPR